jgi:hypothetical protein
LQDDTIAAVVQRETERIVSARLKDQKFVEVEITQAIVSRLSDWAKLFGFFVGIPLALLAIILGFLGVRTYTDFSTKVSAAREEALKPLKDTKKEADRIATAYKDLGAQLEATSALASKVDALSQKVTRIEQAVSFKPSALLTRDLRKSLEQIFGTYYSYLKGVGFTVTGVPPTFSLDTGTDLNSYYLQPPANQIVMTEVMAKLPYPGLREYTHYVLFALNSGSLSSFDRQLPDTQDPTGLESGLADYFPSSFSDQSDVGKEVWTLFQKRYPGIQIRRDLDNHRVFSEIQLGKTEEHDAGNVWGGAFWQIRQTVGKTSCDKLLLQAWKDFDLRRSSTDLTTFPRELLKQDERLYASKYTRQIRDVFQARGLIL